VSRPTSRPAAEAPAAPLPPLAELLSLDQHSLYRLTASVAAESGFGPQSPPYLWASEFPSLIAQAQGLRLSPPVLCVAGSGDNAVWLQGLGLWPCLAVDVSRPACYVGELKAAALLANASRAEYLSLLPSPPRRWLERLAPQLSGEALAFWRAAGESGLASASLLDREPFTGGIAYLKDDDSFVRAASRVRRWPLLNMPLEAYLSRSPESFGTVYVSNVGEYIQRGLLLADREAEIPARLAAFHGLVAGRLAPGGVAVAYVFEAVARAAAGPEAAAMAAAGLALEAHGVEFHRLGTAFHHCLLAGRRG
jgi:hypothetical protein